MTDPISKNEKEWEEALTPEEYHVLREQGTERAFTGKYWDHHEDGIYVCAGCGQPLFESEHKFDSGTGWPSYWKPIEDAAARHEPRDGAHRGDVQPLRWTSGPRI